MKCDRCGAEVETKNRASKYSLELSELSPYYDIITSVHPLCLECNTAVKKWLIGEAEFKEAEE